jgi:ATP-dependent DNA helicase DinG
VVFDEAHHLEDMATKTFGIEFSSRRLGALMDRIRHIRGLDIEKSRLQSIEDLSLGLFAPFLQAGKNEFYFEEALQAEETRKQVEEWTSLTCNAVAELQRDLLEQAREDETLRERVEGIARLCAKAREELHSLFFLQDDNLIRWAERTQYTRGGKNEVRVTLHSTPLSVARILKESLWHRMQLKKGSVTMISATLANSGGFSYQRARLGVPENALECLVGSPFDFKRQAMLYVPGHLPAPAPVSGYMERMVVEIERVLRLTSGRAFLLFTSRAVLNTVYEYLKQRDLPFPLFKQGDLPPGKLVEAFKESGNGCLLGAQTFWEGVDVQGEALSCVIIDRLPFAVPDSPITKARTQAIIADGGDWFNEFSIPQAQIRLKQGFGRLIRTRGDRGIVCILDTRLITKDYGAEFVRYLPPATRASKWARVERFWRGEPATPADEEMPGTA